MAVRFYLVPVIGTGIIGPNFDVSQARRPQFIAGVIAGSWQALDYGDEPCMLIAAEVTPAEHTTLSGHPEVVSVPANLDLTVGANLATVKAALETFNIPSGWVTSGMTYRTILRWLWRLFQVLQRFQGLNVGRLLLALTLDSTIGDLSATKRQRLQDAATSLGLDISGITLATTMRAAFKLLADQVFGTPSMLGVML